MPILACVGCSFSENEPLGEVYGFGVHPVLVGAQPPAQTPSFGLGSFMYGLLEAYIKQNILPSDQDQQEQRGRLDLVLTTLSLMERALHLYLHKFGYRCQKQSLLKKQKKGKGKSEEDPERKGEDRRFHLCHLRKTLES